MRMSAGIDRKTPLAWALMALAVWMPAASSFGAPAETVLPAYFDWESFGVKEGLPAAEVFAVRVDADRIWAGTRNGLALYEKGRWRSFGVADGLPNPVILSLDVSPLTGDLWV